MPSAEALSRSIPQRISRRLKIPERERAENTFGIPTSPGNPLLPRQYNTESKDEK